MRILGYIDHAVYKITVFKMDTRLSIKFENGAQEQTFKFRSSQAINSLTEVRKLIDSPFLASVDQRFQDMAQSFQASVKRNFPPLDEDEFDEII